MTEIMTPTNIVLGAIAVGTARLLIWKYWLYPRRVALIRKIVREEIAAPIPLPDGFWCP